MGSDINSRLQPLSCLFARTHPGLSHYQQRLLDRHWRNHLNVTPVLVAVTGRFGSDGFHTEPSDVASSNSQQASLSCNKLQTTDPATVADQAKRVSSVSRHFEQDRVSVWQLRTLIAEALWAEFAPIFPDSCRIVALQKAPETSSGSAALPVTHWSPKQNVCPAGIILVVPEEDIPLSTGCPA